MLKEKDINHWCDDCRGSKCQQMGGPLKGSYGHYFPGMEGSIDHEIDAAAERDHEVSAAARAVCCSRVDLRRR
jgi:hypothetical protein